MSRAVFAAIGLALVVACGNAHAWFFFFIPGSALSKLGDKITGAEGDNCVASTAKVGDVLTAPSGNTAVIKSLSGTSSRCKDPKLPIRALLTFNYSFSSSAGIDLPEGLKPKELTSYQTYLGTLLSAQDETRKIGVHVNALPRKPGSDGAAWAKNIGDRIVSVIEDGTTSNAEELTINGLKAYRFQAEGKNKGMFGRRFTYLVTVLEGQDEMLSINANCLTDDFPQYKELLGRIAYGVKGLGAQDDVPTVAVGQEQLQPAQPSTPVKQDGAVPTVAIQDTASSQKPLPSGAEPSSKASTDQGAPQVQTSESVANKLREIDKLFKEGVISRTEYEAKKQELLKAL